MLLSLGSLHFKLPAEGVRLGIGKKKKKSLVRYFYLGLGCSEDTAVKKEKMGAGVAGGQASSANSAHLPPLSFLCQSLLVPPLDVLTSLSVMRNLGDVLAKALLSWQ